MIYILLQLLSFNNIFFLHKAKSSQKSIPNIMPKIDSVINNRIVNLKKDFSCFNNNFNLRDELDFLLNRKIKVFIHLEQLIYNTNIYHIGISFNSIYKSTRYDIRWITLPTIIKSNYTYKTRTIFWDYSDKDIETVINYEHALDYKYILGIYDCRHYVRNLTTWACNKPTPVWKLYTLY